MIKAQKKICLDLSLSKAKEIRELNLKLDKSLPQAPTQMEWKDFGGLGKGMMIPDRGFTKQLHCLDKEYEVAWDWGSSKWEIWKFPKDGSEAYHVLTVQTKGREYRDLGADILLKLQEGRIERFSPGQLVKYFEEMDSQMRRKKQKEFLNKIKDIAMDSFLHIHCKKIQVPQKYAIERMVSV